MKTSNWIKGSRLLSFMLLLFVTLLLPACERVDLQPENQQLPGLQAARLEGERIIGPHGECECDQGCRTFPTIQYVKPAPLGYNFAVVVEKVKGCDHNLLAGTKCQFMGESISFSFLDSKFHFSNFTLIDAFPLYPSTAPLPTYGPARFQFEKNAEQMGFSVNTSAIVYFKYKADVPTPTPTELQMASDGICIIGLITEPCPPPCQYPGLFRPFWPVSPPPYRYER